jgi:hypothetical protein
MKCAVSDFYVGALAKLTPPKHFHSIASFDYVTVYAIIHGVAKEDSI